MTQKRDKNSEVGRGKGIHKSLIITCFVSIVMRVTLVVNRSHQAILVDINKGESISLKIGI